ncbi:glycosyltransferase family 4 protein [Anaerosacchariphilus polymeriproducens]|uniref:Glycosyltransferase n=1 Tax=Anaerosacchariphilus polymeriproducens TaxID=1812858 RepID=A0A371ATC8_9FIRM|nr:glycosyltransferase family 4 protein [Anaerosacchariphilus polymeriproducens]RDU22802.1 glycosyltransferase [Anaerosacchariphilus polymeriproducens]
MVILFVTRWYVEKRRNKLINLSGMPTYIYRITKALKERGHEPIVVAASTKTRKEILEGIEVHYVKYKEIQTGSEVLNLGLNDILRDLKLHCEVKKVAKKKKIDLIQYAGCTGTGLFHSNQTPGILRLSTYSKVYNIFENKNQSLGVRFESFLERMASRKMDGIIAPSYAMGVPFGKDTHRNVQIIETPFFNEVKENDLSVYKKRLEDKKYFLYFGNITPNKGVFTIAGTFSELFGKYPDYYFVFIGTDYFYKNKRCSVLMREAAGRYANQILYLSPLEHKQLYPIIEKAELVVLPSLMENFSNACMEAMYFNGLVAATAGTSFEQLIKEEETGFLSIPGNSESLYKAIEKAMNLQEEKKEQIRLAAKKRVEQLRPEIAVARLENYYNYILKKRSTK